MGTRVITIRVTDAAFNQIVGEAEKKNATVADHVRQILSESMNTQMQNARWMHWKRSCYRSFSDYKRPCLKSWIPWLRRLSNEHDNQNNNGTPPG